MKQKMIKFLELEKRVTEGPWEAGDVKPDIDFSYKKYHSGVYADSIGKGVALTGKKDDKQSLIDAVFISLSRTIAPLAVNKLLEAVGLLSKTQSHLEYLAVVLGINRCYLNRQQTLDFVDEIKKFSEDFKNEN